MGLPIAAILTGVVGEVLKNINVKTLDKNQDKIIESVTEKIVNNPVLKNELNQEPLVQSRTFLASLTATLGGLFLIRDQFMLHGIEFWNWSGDQASIAAYAIAIMGLYGLIGRTVNGLRPAFSWIGDLKKIFKKTKIQ